MARKPRLAFHFLHLLGVGHVFRAQRIVHAFLEAGWQVDILHGGHRVPGFDPGDARVHDLPPIAAKDASYAELLDGTGAPLGPDWMAKRQAMLVDIAQGFTPDLVLTEAYPFGRRVVRHEVAAMLNVWAAAERPPLVACSVRDILQPRAKAGRDAETMEVLRRHYDHMLVHADPHLMRLGESFPLAGEIEDMVSYTGFVVPPALENVTGDSVADVVVSAGGGAFGGDMLGAVVAAAKERPSLSFLVATGSQAESSTFDSLRESAPDNVTVVERIEGLATTMAGAKLSISQCGYNTAMDVLAAKVRAVFVPYDVSGQKEQGLRAAALERAGIAVSLPQSALTVPSLLAAMDRSLALPQPALDVDFAGAAATARIASGWMEARA